MHRGYRRDLDDLIDALTAKARPEVDTRDAARDAASREATAAAIATGALRYFLLKYGRTQIITFDLDEALAFTGETGPYVQNGVVRARNIFTKLKDEGHAPDALVERAGAMDLDALLTGEEGDEVWSLMLLMARSEEIASRRSVGGGALWPSTPSPWPRNSTPIQKPKYRLTPERRPRAFRALVWTRRSAKTDDGLLGIPSGEDVKRPLSDHQSYSRRTRALHPAATISAAGRGGASPCPAGAPGGRPDGCPARRLS